MSGCSRFAQVRSSLAGTGLLARLAHRWRGDNGDCVPLNLPWADLPAAGRGARRPRSRAAASCALRFVRGLCACVAGDRLSRARALFI